MPTPYDPYKLTEITAPPYRVGSKVFHVDHPEYGIGTVASITLGGVRVNFPEGPRGWTFKKDRIRIAYI